MSNHAFPDPFLKSRPTEAARQAATRILAGPHLSVLSTTNRDGSSQTSVIFVKPDGDDVLFSTIKGRLKTVNMQRDPRVSLLVHSLPGEGGEITYAAISGSVQLTDDPGGTFHQVMYDLHMGGATPPPEPGRGTADRPAPAETNLRPARVRRRGRVVPRLRSTGHVDQSGAPTQLPCPCHARQKRHIVHLVGRPRANAAIPARLSKMVDR
jgi:PPOX class probable F420-dependent enzyme